MNTMRSITCTLGLAALSFFLWMGARAPEARTASAQESESEKGSSEVDDPAKLSELESKFQEMMSNATLDGQWRLVKDGKLGKERVEKYTIGEVKKIKGDRWTIEARIEYGDKDVKIPVPIRVKWAGDTPVISVTDLWLPGLGKYSARLAIYRGLYAGSWFAPDHGGLMSGVVAKTKKIK